MSINGWSPEGYAEYILAMASVEANKLAKEHGPVVDALEKQKQLEWCVLMTAQKIDVLTKALEEQRELLTGYAIDAAKNREKVTMLLYGVSDFKKETSVPQNMEDTTKSEE